MARITVLINGLVDQVLQDLGGMSPLAKAETPHLDSLAKQSLQPPELGGHESSLLSLLLESDSSPPVGQAPFAARAKGFRLRPDQVAYYYRWCSQGSGTLVDVHDGLCSTQEGKELARDLNEVMGADGFHFIHLQGPMGILLSDHPEMVAAVQASRSLNPIDCLGQNYPSATTGICENPAVTELCVRISEALSAHSINELRADLEEDPINAAIFYGGGPLFRTAKQRGDVFLLSPVAESIGVAKSLGCQTLYLDEETQRFDWVRRSVADIKTWTARSQELVVEWPYVWNSTFKGDLLEKIKTIEWLDKHGLAPLLQLCREENLDLRVLSLRAVDIRDGSITAGMTSLWTSRKGAPVSHWSQVLPEQRPATAAKA